MAKVYALIEFTDAAGTHEIGAELELSRETDADKAEFQRYLDQGMVTTRKPETAEKDDAEEGQRTRRGRG